MHKQCYPWWGDIKAAVRAYPTLAYREASGEAKREYEAVQAAIEATKRMRDGADRLKVIRLVHWEKTHKLAGAALVIPCDRATAARWQRKFFEDVARNRDKLD